MLAMTTLGFVAEEGGDVEIVFDIDFVVLKLVFADRFGQSGARLLRLGYETRNDGWRRLNRLQTGWFKVSGD